MDALKRLGIVLLIASSIIPIYYLGILFNNFIGGPIPQISIGYLVIGAAAIIVIVVCSAFIYKSLEILYQIFRYIKTGKFY